MFNLGFSEIIVLGIIALVFIGPKQLPEVARLVGRLLNEWKRASNEFTDSFKQNDAFREWEERRQQYMADINNSINAPNSEHSQNPQDHIQGDVNGVGFDHAHTESQLEMNLDSSDAGQSNDPHKPDGSQS